MQSFLVDAWSILMPDTKFLSHRAYSSEWLMWLNRLCHVSQVCDDAVNGSCHIVEFIGLWNCNQYKLFEACSPSITEELSEVYKVSDPFPAWYDCAEFSHLPSKIRLCLHFGTCNMSQKVIIHLWSLCVACKQIVPLPCAWVLVPLRLPIYVLIIGW